MADPVSIAASCITVLSTAIWACRQLSKCIDRIAKVPRTVQHCSLLLKSLASTFDQLRSLGREVHLHSQPIELPEKFDDRLNECVTDLQMIEKRMSQVRQSLERNRLRRTWTQMKFNVFDEPHLKEFFERLQLYQSAFSLDLITFQAWVPNSYISLNVFANLVQGD